MTTRKPLVVGAGNQLSEIAALDALGVPTLEITSSGMDPATLRSGLKNPLAPPRIFDLPDASGKLTTDLVLNELLTELEYRTGVVRPYTSGAAPINANRLVTIDMNTASIGNNVNARFHGVSLDSIGAYSTLRVRHAGVVEVVAASDIVPGDRLYAAGDGRVATAPGYKIEQQFVGIAMNYAMVDEVVIFVFTPGEPF
jgi:hypothetical protein